MANEPDTLDQSSGLLMTSRTNEDGIGPESVVDSGGVPPESPERPLFFLLPSAFIPPAIRPEPPTSGPGLSFCNLAPSLPAPNHV